MYSICLSSFSFSAGGAGAGLDRLEAVKNSDTAAAVLRLPLAHSPAASQLAKALSSAHGHSRPKSARLGPVPHGRKRTCHQTGRPTASNTNRSFSGDAIGMSDRLAPKSLPTAANALLCHRSRPSAQQMKARILNKCIRPFCYPTPLAVFVNKVARFFHATFFCTAPSDSWSRGGFSQTSSIGVQFRVSPDQRSGRACLASS